MSPLTGQRPRYLQLAQTLLADINDGKYQIGDILPTEHALRVQFGVSRFTAREAIKQLVKMGMVSRQAGVGTTLISLGSTPVYRQVVEDISDIYQYAVDTQLLVMSREMLVVDDTKMAEFLHAKPGEEWLKVKCLRRYEKPDMPPICYTEIFLHPTVRTAQGFDTIASAPIFKLIEEQFGEKIVEVRQQIDAATIPNDLAALLETSESTCCLWITRSYLNARGETIEVTRSAHPTDRFQYQQVFRQDH